MYASSFHIGKKIDNFSNVGARRRLRLARGHRCRARRRRVSAADAFDSAAHRVLGRGDAAATITPPTSTASARTRTRRWARSNGIHHVPRAGRADDRLADRHRVSGGSASSSCSRRPGTSAVSSGLSTWWLGPVQPPAAAVRDAAPVRRPGGPDHRRRQPSPLSSRGSGARRASPSPASASVTSDGSAASASSSSIAAAAALLVSIASFSGMYRAPTGTGGRRVRRWHRRHWRH